MFKHDHHEIRFSCTSEIYFSYIRDVHIHHLQLNGALCHFFVNPMNWEYFLSFICCLALVRSLFRTHLNFCVTLNLNGLVFLISEFFHWVPISVSQLLPLRFSKDSVISLFWTSAAPLAASKLKIHFFKCFVFADHIDFCQQVHPWKIAIFVGLFDVIV
jgi:hypothetical protein